MDAAPAARGWGQAEHNDLGAEAFYVHAKRGTVHSLAGEGRLKCGFEVVLRGGPYRLRGVPPLAVTCIRCFPATPRGVVP